jgi:chromosome segregation ATPase
MLSNVCINENFLNATRIEVLQQTVYEQCTTNKCEVQPKIFGFETAFEKEMKELKSNVSSLRSTISLLKAENSELKAENSKMTAEKLELKTDKQQCQQQLGFIEELQQKLDSQWNTAHNELLRNKFYEISDLNDRLQHKEAEINENQQVIEHFKKKFDLLNKNLRSFLSNFQNK